MSLYEMEFGIFKLCNDICKHLSNISMKSARIDITVDNSIRLTSCDGQIIVSLSNTGEVSALKHPNGYVHQFGKFAQIITNDGSKRNNYTYVARRTIMRLSAKLIHKFFIFYSRYANMCSNGISFTSGTLREKFLLDSIGTRKLNDYFPKLHGDNTSTVFLR